LGFVGEEKFACDPCSPSSFNIPADLHYTEEEDGLVQTWPKKGDIWVNPPFKQAKDWAKKCCDHYRTNPECAIWLLLPVRSGTKYYQELIYNASSFTFFFQGKLTFGKNGVFKDPARFGIQLTCFVKDPLKYARRFGNEFPLKGAVMINPNSGLTWG
jgi:hypothetical protein